MLKIKDELFALLEGDGISGVRKALQSAIELEHSTMPPYLYALYSLGASNAEARTRLRQIVIEEMLHMLLACNILNAIDGHPEINKKEFVPTYPGPLPGTVATELTVDLAPYSLCVVKHVFMRIEEPEHPIVFPFEAERRGFRTIGQFYAAIKARLESLGNSYFTGDRNNQVTTDRFHVAEDKQKVIDLDSAKVAIDIIVEQGEGTTQYPVPDPAHPKDLAHYYRFEELVKMKTLVPVKELPANPKPEDRYTFGDPPIPFEPKVLPLMTNPKHADYKDFPNALELSEKFNKTYTRMLKSLHEIFNGSPAGIEAAIDQMTDELKAQAKDLVKVPIGGGFVAGPTFEYME